VDVQYSVGLSKREGWFPESVPKKEKKYVVIIYNLTTAKCQDCVFSKFV